MAAIVQEPGIDQGRAQPVIREGMLDLHLLSRIAKAESVTVLTIMVVVFLASILYLHLARQKYAVRMVINAVSTKSQSSNGSLEDLSSLAGIDLPSAGSSQFRLFVGALRSPFAAQAIAADEDLVKAMFPREWSASEGKWHEPPNIALKIAHAVGAALGWHIPPWQPPGVSRVFEYLKDQLKIVPDNKSGVVTLEIDSPMPKVAERVLLTMNNAVDERMRQHDLTRATIDLDYLSKRLSTVNVEDYRKALVTNMVDQEKTRMLASAPLPYVSDVLGKPLISEKPVSPVPLAVLVGALILGGLLGLGVASVRYRRR
jgi:uncharacterized protein involved in exopolysaccharide biosynthesis